MSETELNCFFHNIRLIICTIYQLLGSTLQNILLRYGYKHGLSFAIPIKNWMFSFDELFNANMVTRYDWNPDNQFDMMAFHSLWNGPQVDLVIPKPSKRITLLRDPVDTFESGFVYMGLEKNLKMNINQYAQWIKMKHFPTRKPKSWFDKDELLWDLGADVAQLEEKDYLRDRIKVYETEFDLVLIADRFDESLILLQDLLCWDTEDVTYLMQNERDAKFKNTTISPESRLILQQWLSGDYLLYDYFNHQLGEKLKQLGTQVVEENLKALRHSNQVLKESCNAHFVDNESLKGTPLHMAHHMVKAYDIAENCIYYAMAEPAFYNQIKKQQKAGKPTPQNISKSKR